MGQGTLPHDDVDLHFYLIRGMARRHGINLSEAMGLGILSRPDFAAMIELCRNCPGAPAGCREFQEDDADATTAPPWCANGPIIEGLRGLV